MKRTASEQFFRAEIVGAHPVNTGKLTGTRFELVQNPETGIDLLLWDGNQKLIARHIAASAISCDAGRWLIEGNKDWASGWLLLTGSGSASWENLWLWQDDRDDLMVDGIRKGRHALFLIPMLQEDRLFMVFSSQEASDQ